MCKCTQAPAVSAVSAVAIGGAVFSSVLILKVQLAAGFISSFVCQPPTLPPPIAALPYLTMQGKNWALCLYLILCHTPRVANNLPRLDIISASAGFFFPVLRIRYVLIRIWILVIHTTGLRIRILLFSSVAFKMPTRIKFFFLSYFP
jgi:hypothetical protein